MAKLIRFPLRMADGTGVRTLEDLREHGDMESVLQYYQDGRLARWLKAFGHTELAERVAAHRNGQLEGTRENLRGVFEMLELAVDEEELAGYCRSKLGEQLVLEEAEEEAGTMYYGQGVSVKEKVLPYFPTQGAEAEKLREELAHWEVTAAELDGGLVQVACTSERHSFSSSQQMEKGDDLYNRIYQVLRCCMEMPKYHPKVTAAIGKAGPGGGIIFHIDGPKAYEVSGVLGNHKWEEAKRVAEAYRGGGFGDWRLPTKEELDLVYQNLRKPGIIKGDETFWSSSQSSSSTHHWVQRFGDGGQDYFYATREFAVRAIRGFSIGG